MTKTLDENFIDWEGNTFGFGYGSGEPHTIPALKRFFELCQENGAYDYQLLECELSPTVAWLLINILASDRISVLEYGTSPRYAWLTDEGAALKKFFASKTPDELVSLATEYDHNYVHCYPDACNCGPDGYAKGAVCKNPFWKRRP
jgi:hypothetical protein